MSACARPGGGWSGAVSRFPFALLRFLHLRMPYCGHKGVTPQLVGPVLFLCFWSSPERPRVGPGQISRLLHAHELIIQEARWIARIAADHGDDGTNDLLVSD